MRRPAKLERAGALTPRDRIWAAVRSFGRAASFSVAEIMVLSEQRADTVLSYFAGLRKAEYIERSGEALRPTARPRRECALFWLNRDVGVEAPRVTADGAPVTQGVGRDQMWRSMRVLKSFDCRALAAAASTEQHAVAVDEATTYLRLLSRAGYLRLDRKGTGRARAIYSFVRSRDTGPRAPLITRDKSVMDGNTGVVVYESRIPSHESGATGGSHAG